MSGRADVAVIGGGILGLSHAWAMAKRGKKVVLFERGLRASGASIRNFGMVWPIGQPAGMMHQTALRSAALWREVLTAAKLPFFPTGSLHVGYHEDEAEVLREFAEKGPAAGYPCAWQNPAQILERSDAIRPDGLRGGLWSETEMTVDPRRVIAGLPEYLTELGVEIHFGEAVRRIQLPVIETARGAWEVDQAIVCSGDDFETLYPELFAVSGLIRCKLQMMRTAPQPDHWQLGPALAAGLTLRFYKAFRLCASLESLKARVAREKAPYDEWAIHVLVSQTADGAITLGDSHEYSQTVDIFDRADVDDLILREAETFLQLPDWRIAQRWHGVYSQHPEKPFFEAEPEPGVHILTGVGGSGMTLSFGLAERTAENIL